MKDNKVSVTINVGGKEIIIESGLLAQQAAGCVTVRLGDTILIAAVTCSDNPKEGIDYFPLQVEYREKYYAAGKFPGGFFKREARPAEKETLTARLTDRPLRPLFPDSYRNEVQVNIAVLSADGENDSDVLTIIGASAALTISNIPFMGPIAGVRMGRVNGQLVVNPTHVQRAESDLDLIYCGNRNTMMMIEGDAKEMKEADLLAAMKACQAECVKLVDAQLELRRKMGLPEKVVAMPEQDKSVLNAAREFAGADMAAALLISGKQDRHHKINEIKTSLKEKLLAKLPEMTDEQFRSACDELEIEQVRANILERGQRIGGRGFDEVRTLVGQVGLLPRTHGSALFSRGETQALGTVTLGTKSDAQELDIVTGGPDEKRFMLHYNFPPYSTGEVGRLGSTSRRELGHGALAEKSLEPIVPADYPYTVRLVSDIMGSNGSSSMASVCAGCLAMMDAGIPIRKPAAGISIGLVADAKKAKLLVDILGDEDHCGDMDFKVAGTRDGITGFQVDLKIGGLSWDLVEQTLEKAKIARNQILDFMATVIAAPRAELSPYAPRIHVIKIDPEKIGALIGPGGKNIRRITEMSGAQIDIEEDGTVNIFAVNGDSMAMAVSEVEAVVAEVEIDKIYQGTVTGVKEFGCFVEVLPGKEGLVHISELADFRVKAVEDICKIGDQIWVKCIGVDDRGRVKLSRKEAMREKDGKTDTAAPAR
jgi:polyribonucleotide nucleotidyltransferase